MLPTAFFALFASLLMKQSTPFNSSHPLPAATFNEIAYSSSPPPPSSRVRLDRRDNPWSVYLCEGKNWTQPCHYIRGSQGECFTMYEEYQGKIQSFGPDRNQTCTLYDQVNCAAETEEGRWMSWNLEWPGNRTMRSGVVKTFWSWRCVAEGTKSIP